MKYLDEIARGGADRAAALRPAPAAIAAPGPADHERMIDHAGFIADWADAKKSAEAFKRGEAIYGRVCANCHGTHAAPGSAPTALRFAEGKFKAGADPYAMYRTLTSGTGQMVAQSWMVPSQKYDVIHSIREAYLKDGNPSFYEAITAEYLAGLPKGTSRGPEPSNIEPWRLHDYGPFLGASIEVGGNGTNVARKGLAVRLDPGPGGIGRGGAWILYELDTLRVAAIWTGDGFIDWRGINFDGSHGTHPRVVGNVLAQTPTLPGWAYPVTGSFVDPRPLGRDGKPYGPLPRSHAQFNALHHASDAVVLDYTVGDTRVLEAARLESSSSGNPLVTRIWSVAPHDCELAVRVAAVGQERAGTAAAIVGGSSAAARIEVRDGFHVLVLPQQTLAAGGTGPQLQGGLVALPMPDLPTGIMRGRFSPHDHALYACGLFAWAGNKTLPGGFFRVRRTAAPVHMPIALAATADGFTITFSAPLDRARAGDPRSWSCRSWRLERTEKYGSPHLDERGLTIPGVHVSSDGCTATVRFGDFGPLQCYELTWRLVAADGTPVIGRINGTVHAAR